MALEAEAAPRAREAALKALALDNSLPEAHLALAEVELYQDWNFTGAEKEFRKTLELNPNYSTGHQWYGEFLSLEGRHPEAIRQIEIAVTLDPLSAIIHHQAGQTTWSLYTIARATNQDAGFSGKPGGDRCFQ